MLAVASKTEIIPNLAFKYALNMPTFRIFSDLHLEFDKGQTMKLCKQLSVEKPADYLILAGDIVNYPNREKLYELLTDTGMLYKGIFYVLGNHEYYGNPFYKSKGRPIERIGQKVMEPVIQEYRRICDDIGIILLENESCTIDDSITIYGSTFWTNLSLKAIKFLNDKSYIGPDEVIERHANSKKMLDNYLKVHNNRTIVVTHHMPSYQFIADKYYEEDPENGMNAGFASNSEELFKSPITDWVFGHTHVPMSKYLNGINFWCNPHGYPGENFGYDDLVIN